MNEANIMALLILFVALAVHACRYWATDHQSELAEIYRYRLFSLRDQLVRLVAERRVNEEDKTFIFLYRTINDLLPICKPIGLRGLLRVLTSAKTPDAEWTENFELALRHELQEVRATTKALIITLADIIILKSFSIRLAAWYFSMTASLRKTDGPERPPKNEAFRVYKELDHMRRAA